MEIAGRAPLRSLLNESGRQHDFYTRRNEPELAEFWGEMEHLAASALQAGASLLITERVSVTNPPILKGGEQGQQLPNNNVIKAFR